MGMKKMSFEAEAGYWDEYCRDMGEGDVGHGVNSNGLGSKSLLVAVLFRAIADLAVAEPHIRRSARGWFAVRSESGWYVFSYYRICDELGFDADIFLRRLKALGLFPADGSRPAWKPYDLTGKMVQSLPRLFGHERE